MLRSHTVKNEFNAWYEKLTHKSHTVLGLHHHHGDYYAWRCLELGDSLKISDVRLGCSDIQVKKF